LRRITSGLARLCLLFLFIITKPTAIIAGKLFASYKNADNTEGRRRGAGRNSPIPMDCVALFNERVVMPSIAAAICRQAISLQSKAGAQYKKQMA